jgi:signal peptidase I
MLRARPRLRRLVDWGVTIGVAIAAILVFQAEVAKPYRIPSASMEPTLHCARPSSGCRARFSDRVLAFPIVYRFRDPHRGDLVVFRTPPAAAAQCRGGTFVKRIIGLPGEIVSERDGYVLVDGKRLDEPYVPAAWRDHRTQTWPRVPRRAYFMMGDNRRSSCDSRDWGPVPRENLKGPVLATYWPPNRVDVK